ncbi:MAG: TetR/AcrR family transcriptional regulator [Gammaproteobacteria bacterium]|nr:TetR/AcrR family transcriptional regulator [Gammaproteobacteria bacterium]
MTRARPAKTRKTRAEKTAETRQALMRAAAEVVGEVGYYDASIARITQRAGVAQGTFYLYFENQQELFDQLLPTIGGHLLEDLAERVHGARNILEVEEAGFRGFFEFLRQNPSFFRILNEAEVAAPVAHEKHFGILRERYLHALERSWKAGELPDYDQQELEVLAYILMAARSYLYLRYSKDESGPKPIPEWVVQTFMKFVRGGFLQGRTSLDESPRQTEGESRSDDES